jgi:DME family drug/metabolite transporter
VPYILLAATLWGLLGPVATVAMRAGVTALEVAFWRAAIAGALFAVHALLRRRGRVATRDLPAVGAFGLVGVSLFYASYLLAVQRGGAALAAVLLYTAPAWVAVLARLVLGERLTARRAGAVALTVGGVALVALAGGGAVRLRADALLWGLAAGWSYALYYIFGRRFFTRYDAATVLAVALPVGAAGLLPFTSFTPKDAAAWGAIVFVAVVPTYLAYLLYATGLRRVEATRAATLATLEPVVAAVAAYAAFGEVLAPAGYLGAAVVLAGVLLSAAEPRREDAAPARR